VLGNGVRAVVVLLDGDTEVVVGRIVGAHADIGFVNVVARMQLAARRGGFVIRLRDVCAELYELLDLAGLTGAVETCVLAVEPRRESELGEEVGVQEVRDRDDPVA
jgi:hypothetical protein